MLEHIIKFVSKKEVYGVVFIIAAAYIIYRFSGVIFEKIITSGKTELEKKKRHTIVKLFKNIFKYIMYIVIILIILELNGVNTKSLIAGLGVVGALLGLALQDTLKDLINGITIIMDNFYVVGDLITYGGFTGEVIDLGLKTTKIKAVDGEVKIISNRNVTEVINLSQKTPCLTLEIPTGYDDDIDKVEKILTECVEQLKERKEVVDAKYLGIEKLDNSSVNYAIRIWCTRGSQWDTKREALKLVKQSYAKEGVTIPYQQIEVHNGKKL